MAEQIAALPEQRRLGWLCDWLHTTPADPRLLDLTDEQMYDLWLQFSFLHPDRVKKPDASFVDEEFEEFEREVAAANEGVLYNDTVVVPYGEAAPVFVEPPKDEWEDV